MQTWGGGGGAWGCMLHMEFYFKCICFTCSFVVALKYVLPYTSKTVIFFNNICNIYIVFLQVDAAMQNLAAFYKCMGQNIHFYFMPNCFGILRSCSMKIFCQCPTVYISKLNY